MTSKPAINTPPSNSDDWANDVQSALGLEAKNEAGKLQQNGGTNTTANLSNPITNADKEKKESESSTPANANPSTPDVDTSMPGGFAGGIASAGTGVSLKDASGQAKDAAAKAYEAATNKVNAYTANVTQAANEKGPNDLHEVAEKLKQDDHDPSVPVKDLANNTQPGVVGEYSDKAAAAVAGLAGTGIALGAAGVVATNETTEEWKPKVYGDDVLSNPMDFPRGTFPTLERLQTQPSTIPHIEGVTAARVEKQFIEKKTEEKKQDESNKATEALAGVTAGAGGAGAASAVVANKYAQPKGADEAKSAKSEKTNTIATDQTGHNVSPPSSSANLVKNSKESSKVTPKRSFSQRIRGDMKIFFGKLSKNDGKVSQGKEMKGN